MAALLSSDQGDSDRVAIEIEECRNMGIKIMAPDINESFASFTVVTAGTKENVAIDKNSKVDTIRFGLNAIKNVGAHIVEMIIQERKANGPYLNIFDLLERITDKDLNKKSLESLIKGGALDNYEERGKLLANTERLLSLNKEIAKSKDNKQISLFADLPISSSISSLTLNDAPPAEQNEKLIWEKELLGLYVSEHPFNFFRKYLNNYAISLASLKAHRGDDRIISAGVISTIKKILTRKGESMLFVKIEDSISTVELLIFPRLLKESLAIWQAGNTVIIEGTISEKDQDLKILVNRAMLLRENEPQKSVDEFKKIIIEGGPAKRAFYRKDSYQKNKQEKSDNDSYSQGTNAGTKPLASSVSQSSNPLKVIFLSDLNSDNLEKLKNCFAKYPGDEEVYFKVIDDGKAKIIKTAYRVQNNSELLQELKKDFISILKIVEN
jgi:DNA polymerase-3 subunit alpha